MLFLTGVTGWHASRLEATYELRPTQTEITTAAYVVPLALNLPESRHPSTPQGEWQEARVQAGDTLSSLLGEHEISTTDLQALLVGSGHHRLALTRIHPGISLRWRRDADGRLAEFHYPLDATRTLLLMHGKLGFSAWVDERPIERRIGHASGVISSSLFESAQDAGLPQPLIIELAQIFGWDIDFALDIRAGDSFAVLYEEHYAQGEHLRSGRILAARFINDGKVHVAFGFELPGGRFEYFNEQGKPLRKAFFRTPVEFSRISSGFNLKRRHPVLNRIRAHRGVDYAAPNGTPVRATRAGRIALAGTKGGYGKVIEIDHDRRYSTLYGHLSRFAKGLRAGARVEQGQVIGYVGATGLATGPHLHYELRVDGVHRDPLSVQYAEEEPVPAALRASFLRDMRKLNGPLETVHGSLAALD